jgi:hypothetical protein
MRLWRALVCVRQLGDGTTDFTNAPPGIDVLAGVAAVSAGQLFTCALMTTGGVRCWGLNNNGQASLELFH